MRVDFYLLSRDPLEKALPQIARSAKKAGQRSLVVSADEEQRNAIDRALWEFYPEDFLAHGHAGGPHDARQPLLLSESCQAGNGASLIVMADGTWRDEAYGFERALLFFDQSTIDNARETWRMLGNRKDVDRRFWKQEGGRWVEGP